jgi:hypothetical protein
MASDHPIPALKVDEVMRDVEIEVRRARRERLLAQGGARGYADPAIYASVDALLHRAIGQETLLLPELVDDDLRLATHLRFSSHRPLLGSLIIFVKRRAILPLTRWLFEYSLENFRRQERVNHILIGCIEELAIENARLRQDLRRLTDAGSR